jgi:hypothetical protein
MTAAPGTAGAAGVSSFPLPTDTAHVRIESRQYRIFNFDLGEGVARWKAGVAAAIVVPYWLLLALLQVSPLAGNGRGSMLYVFPAVLLVWASLRPDAGGRPHYALWLDRARFLARRRSPMIDTPLAAVDPAGAFIVSAEWVMLDPARTRRLRAAASPTPAAGSAPARRTVGAA